MQKNIKIAIIGFGPRGLSCLEDLVYELSNFSKNLQPHFLIFETSENLGTGKAWEIDQPETNYINISDHALQDLKGREKMIWNNMTIPSFPSYIQWCLDTNKVENMEDDKDVYPERSQMGKYLNGRATSLCDVLLKNNFLSLHKEHVNKVEYVLGNVTVFTNKTTIEVHECLLTMGHTAIKDSDETKQFKKHAKEQNVIYIHNPYEELIAREDLSDMRVAIKGFGLSMLDISRQLTNYKFGEFKKKSISNYLTFIPDKGCVKQIIPYSFDGLPCVPKPYGRKVDELFEPSLVQINSFELAIRNELSEPKKIKNLNFILNAFAAAATSIFIKNNSINYNEDEISEVIKKWVQDTNTKHDLILDTQLPTLEYMKQTVEMSMGKQPASLDFTIGQVWRHLQPTMYRLFAFSGISAKLMKELIEIDQEIKRYSYGPPVESILQLIALVEAGILNLDYVNDPEVETIKKGWKLTKNGQSVIVGMLCNSVMDGPVLEKFENPIFNNLVNEKLMQSVHEDLGVLTNPDGTIVPVDNHSEKIPIAVLGRNAKGSVLGVDAILECFSPETHDWARGVIKGLVENL
ncbi:MAG: FAD/NAD(P)-binding protein [Patiriisocius sp.]|uniref:FAD/NAD(P)-binding protein n=1 Tax=Patiriisocius sp. TaxID=2822396 RepID=UPI003EF32A30